MRSTSTLNRPVYLNHVNCALRSDGLRERLFLAKHVKEPARTTDLNPRGELRCCRRVSVDENFAERFQLPLRQCRKMPCPSVVGRRS